METLGSLCDKLSVVKLKEFHNIEPWRGTTLRIQSRQLSEEIDRYFGDAASGIIPPETLVCLSTKIYKKEGNEIPVLSGDIGFLIAELANVNCRLWHDVEKSYDFESVPTDEKNKVVKNLARLNLQRNQCVDLIDQQFQKIIIKGAKQCNTKKQY